MKAKICDSKKSEIFSIIILQMKPYFFFFPTIAHNLNLLGFNLQSNN